MKNVKFLWSVIVVLFLIVSLMGYKFVSGSVAPSDDSRLSVLLTKDERDLILTEMREFLISVQGVSQAITENNHEQIAKVATNAGMQAEANTPGSIFRKIPLEMKKLGFDTRSKFDEIAKSAQEKRDFHEIRQQLDTLLNNCIACHTMFRLPEERL